VPYGLSSNGTLPFRMPSLSGFQVVTPSPGWRGSPLPPQTPAAFGMHGRLHVKPPFVERLTKIPPVSFSRSKWIWP
jgi:hypothetical protein